MEKENINLKNNDKSLNLTNNKPKNVKKVSIQKVRIKKNHYKQRLDKQKFNNEVMNSKSNVEIKNYNNLDDFLESRKQKTESEKTSFKLQNNDDTNLKNETSKITNSKDPISKVEQKKSKIEQKKSNIEKKIRKNYGLKFSKTEETLTQDGIELKTKFRPHLEFRGFQQKDSFVRKGYYKLDNTFRSHIHSKIQENENDNDTLKALHSIEKSFESRLTDFSRNSNYRNLKKYYKLKNQLKNIDSKQNFNNLKSEYNLNFSATKTIKPTQKASQKQRNKKKMFQNQRFSKLKKSIKIRSKIFLARSKSLTNIFSFKMITPLLVGFSMILFIAMFFSIFSLFDNSNSLYDLQKAELYYRELEANLEYEENITINHNPIYLASLLLAQYGEFEFNEETQKYLDEIFDMQKDRDLTIKDIADKTLNTSDYEYFLFLYETKCGLAKYSSPFDFDYEKYISSYVGYRIDPTSEQKSLELHKGLDIAVDQGTEILAISDGIVLSANFSASYGNIITIYHTDGYTSKYAHCQSIKAKTGEKVSQGEVIAFVGSTGESTGNHLHLEILDETGSYMNPMFLIERWSEVD